MPSYDPYTSATTTPGGGRMPPDEATETNGNGAHSPAAAFDAASRSVKELGEYAAYYASAKIDRIKATIRNLGFYAALGLVAGVAGLAVIATAGVLIVTGIAGALAALFNHTQWLGDLVTGIVLLGLVLGGAFWFLSHLTKTSREQTVKKYEDRRRQQQADFGHDVRERADAQRSQPH